MHPNGANSPWLEPTLRYHRRVRVIPIVGCLCFFRKNWSYPENFGPPPNLPLLTARALNQVFASSGILQMQCTGTSTDLIVDSVARLSLLEKMTSSFSQSSSTVQMATHILLIEVVLT